MPDPIFFGKSPVFFLFYFLFQEFFVFIIFGGDGGTRTLVYKALPKPSTIIVCL